jgi:hypothetical protein
MDILSGWVLPYRIITKYYIFNMLTILFYLLKLNLIWLKELNGLYRFLRKSLILKQILPNLN